MLTLQILGQECFDENTNKFLYVGSVEVTFEHSLVSLSKWESKFQKPFLGQGNKSTQEIFDYIECMVLTPGITTEQLTGLSEKNLADLNAYIDSKQSATTFNEFNERKGSKTEVVTSELIYDWMIAFNIPFSCETWHLNRLLTLIRVCNVKNSKPKKMSKTELAQRNRTLNAERKARLNTSG